MYTVYVLKSLKDQKRYIGMTSELTRRIDEHNFGKVKSTRNRRQFILFYTEEFNTKEEATAREKFFKTGKGREFLNSIKN
ncbi:MAG: GIY-YIG nuclease family protein [Ignavibacteriales bacterium]|nr:MAG: GIY-YIG nuclease family protein [Ignavibacteriales bacterium]